MKKWLWLSIIAIGCMVLFVCSDDNVISDDDNDDDPPLDSVFNITATANNAYSSTEEISAASGGDVNLTDGAGVSYTLIIPPYSLANDTTITLTAFDTFALTGPVTFNCVDSGNSSGFCFEGVMCEPSGLFFDSGATLIIQFPATPYFPLDSGINIIYFDQENTIFYPCETEQDTTNRTLSCTIYHFSGYVTNSSAYMSEDDFCQIMQSSFIQLKDIAQASIMVEELQTNLSMIYDLNMRNHYTNTFNPLDPTAELEITCTSLFNMIDGGMPDILNSFWGNLQTVWNGNNSPEYIPQMISDLEHFCALYGIGAYPTAVSVQGQIQQAMLVKVSDRIKTWAETGHTLCANTNETECEEGRTILTDVLGYADQGYVVNSSGSADTDFITQAQNWLNDCCASDFNINLTVPGSTTIYRLAMSPDDVYADQYTYVCSVNVAVSGPSGTPLEGIPIQLWREGATSKLGTHSTDENGNAGFIIEPRFIDWNCQEYENWTFYAKAYDASSESWSEPSNSVAVMFVNSTVTTTINYQFHYEWSAGDYSSSAEATVTGTGSSPIRPLGNCISECTGALIRTYSYSNCNPIDGCNTGTSLTDDGVYACRAVGDIDEILLDNGKTVEFLIGLRVNLGSAVFAGLQYETSSGTTETLQYGLAMSVWPEDGFYFADENGVDGDTTWVWDSSGDPNAVGLKTVTYSVSVSLDNKK